MKLFGLGKERKKQKNKGRLGFHSIEIIGENESHLSLRAKSKRTEINYGQKQNGQIKTVEEEELLHTPLKSCFM